MLRPTPAHAVLREVNQSHGGPGYLTLCYLQDCCLVYIERYQPCRGAELEASTWAITITSGEDACTDIVDATNMH